MNSVKKYLYQKRCGATLIVALIFVLIFCGLAVSLASLSGSNAQLADKQCKISSALSAAQSGIECGKYIVSQTLGDLGNTPRNYISADDAQETWDTLCQKMQALQIDGHAVANAASFSDEYGSGVEIVSEPLNFVSDTDFTVRFYRYDNDPCTIKLQSRGVKGEVARKITVDMEITKESEVLNYAIASRGRMWVTGDSTIHGDIFSSWDRFDISPFNMTSDSRVEGTINTVLSLEGIENAGAFQMETLDADGNPIFDFDSEPVFEPLLDEYGEPIFDPFNYRVYDGGDEIQGYHRNINYDQPDDTQMPGMDIDDYDTDEYKAICYDIGGDGDIPSSGTIEVEYFPHAPSSEGGYSMPRDGSPGNTWNRKLNRHVYENQTFTNARLPDDRNALFRNCTFEEVLYIDCYKSGSSKYNNVRFEDCTFNGTIVTDAPQSFKWKHNALYFTGEATFENTSDIQEATILAPHFNVNLGNTNPDQGEYNIITGAVVGGIVDVRGNAEVYGTIISMCDTTGWSSGYVTNIGATLGDGGSETTELGDIGVIEITPDKDKMLPSGIMSPIVINPLQNTYSEG